MTTLKTLGIAAVLSSALLFSCGSSVPDVGLGDRLAVGMDNDLVGGSPGSPATWDTVTILFINDSTPSGGEHNYATWEADSTAAHNSGGIVELVGDPGFAFAVLDSANPNSTIGTIDANSWYRLGIWSSAETVDRWRLTSASRANVVMRVPFGENIPANSQIVSAEFRTKFDGTTYVSAVDSFCVTLMNSPGDSLWWSSIGTTAPSSGLPNAAHATWRYQISGLNTAGYPASNGGAWVPDLNSRERFWEYGDYSDFSGNNNGGNLPSAGEYHFKLTNCVQAIVNGAENNGLMFSYADWNSSLNFARMYSPQALGAISDDCGYFLVKYLTRTYRSPWPGGADWAFVLQADDGRAKINEVLIDSLAVRSGGKFTTFITQPLPGGLDATYIGWTDLLDACVAGVVEIGSHSVWSWSLAEGAGLNHYAAKGAIAADGAISEWSLGMYPDTLTAAATVADSLYYDVDPSWLDYEATASGYGSLTSSSIFGRSFGVPVANHNPWAQKALVDVGYSGVRILADMSAKYDADGHRDYYTLGYYRPAASDTIYQGLRPDHRGVPRNLRFIANWPSIENIVGAVTDDYSEAVVKFRLRNAIENTRAQGRRYVAMLVHDVKTDPDGPGQYDTSSLDADEASWMFDIVDSLGGRYMTISEVGDWLYANAYADSVEPAGWATPDSFRVPDAWGTPYGIDDTFIRGLR